MTKQILTAVLMLSIVTAYAQKPPVKKPVPAKSNTTTTTRPLKNMKDSVSYAIGLSVANFYAQQGFGSLNADVVAKACEDVFGKKQLLINEPDANAIIMKYMEATQAEKAKPVIAANEKFLAENKNKPRVKTTASGLQYEILRDGTGPKPAATDTVVVNYAGTLIDGTEFDNSYKRGQPIEFPLNRVIPGWTEGVQLMPVGSKFKFYIPQQLGYGMHGAGNIPGGAALIFEVELLSIKGK